MCKKYKNEDNNMCCGGINFSSIMMSPGFYSGGWGCGIGTYFPNSCFGWGYSDRCCDPYGFKSMMTGIGIGAGYAASELVIAGVPKLISWIGGLFHKKNPDTASA